MKLIAWLISFAILAIVILTVQGVFDSPSFRGCVYDKQTSDGSQSGQTPQEYSAHFSVVLRYEQCIGSLIAAQNNTITAISTVLLTFVTAALVWVGYMQINTTRNQLRSYVSVTMWHYSSFNAGGAPFFEFKMLNVGITPAFKVSHRSMTLACPNPLPANYPFPSITAKWSTPFVLFPQETIQGTKTADVAFTANEIEDIRTDSKRPYVLVEIAYHDTFGRRHWTTVNAAVVADADTRRKLAMNYNKRDLVVSFEKAPVGNDAH